LPQPGECHGKAEAFRPRRGIGGLIVERDEIMDDGDAPDGGIAGKPGDEQRVGSHRRRVDKHRLRRKRRKIPVRPNGIEAFDDVLGRQRQPRIDHAGERAYSRGTVGYQAARMLADAARRVIRILQATQVDDDAGVQRLELSAVAGYHGNIVWMK
jgi:hypothetical protein